LNSRGDGVIKFAAHLEMNFGKGVSFRDRWTAAKESGFQGCEFVWRNVELAEALDLKSAAPMQVSCLGGTTGGAGGGPRPVLLLAEDRERLAKDVETAAAYARQLNCRNLVMVPGNMMKDWSIEKHRQEIVTSLKYIAPLLEQAGVTALVEPLNSKVDHKGVYCDTATEGFRIVEEVGSSNVKILYDIYHMQIMEGNLIQTIENNHSRIGYFHLAKVPGRFEPIGGEIHYPAVLEAVAKSGYDGFVGLEYRPSQPYNEVFQQIKSTYPDYF
jgi:hydroxypyruvate isomerase